LHIIIKAVAYCITTQSIDRKNALQYLKETLQSHIFVIVQQSENNNGLDLSVFVRYKQPIRLLINTEMWCFCFFNPCKYGNETFHVESEPVVIV